jgi:hypothetical protein
MYNATDVRDSFVIFALGFPFTVMPLWERQRGTSGTTAAACHSIIIKYSIKYFK